MGQAAHAAVVPSESGDGELDGRWINDGGTVIDLRSHRDGRLSGTIRFASDGNTYRPFELRGTCMTRPDGHRGLVGTVSGWPHAGAITVWCGDLDPVDDVLATRLLMTGGISPITDWEASTGGPAFYRGSARTTGSRRRPPDAGGPVARRSIGT